jgi:adenylate cyclase
MAAAPAFAQSSQAVGHITPIVDTDGSIRRVPAVVCYEGNAYPALAVAALSAATGAQPVFKTAPGLVQSGQVLDVGGIQMPVDAKGQLRVSYQMPRAGFVSVSAVDVIQGKVPAHMLKGSWALVGSTAFGGGDAVPTPQGGAVGGVEVHAQILSAALDGRTPFVPAWAPLWPLATGALALLALIFSLKASGPKAAVAVPAVALACGAVIFAAHAALLLGLHQWLGWGQPALFVALAASLLTAAEMLRVRAERESLYQNLSSYLPEGAARRVAFQEPTAQVVAETREATVMMVDLRNFSAYCEERSPEDAATVLHIFYTTVEKIVTEHGGVVEQMVGDGLTAVWNGSSPCDQHALQALKAAKVIWQEGVAQLPKVASRKTPPLDIGVGIESGPVMVGSFGPARRRVHTVMGEAVSVASRLEKLTAELGYPVLLGPKALAQCGASLQAQDTQKLGDFLLSGMRAPRTVYALNVPIDPSHLQLVSSMEAGAVG